MSLSHPSIEWHFLKESENKPSNPQVSENINIQHDEHIPPELRNIQLSRLYELLLAIALIYGIAVFWVWQRTEQKMTLLGNEMASLQQELIEVKSEAINDWSDHTERISTEDSTQPLIHQFETDYLQFEVGEREADIVKSSLLSIDSTYRQFHQDLGVPLNLSASKLKIIVDPIKGLPEYDEQILVIPSPRIAAKRYEVAEADALLNEISMRLIANVLDKALQNRDVKPQWHGLVLELSFYLRRENGYDKNWQQTDKYLQRRHLAQDRAISLVQGLSYATDSAIDDWAKQEDVTAQIADPIIEFVIETYGYSITPTLLDAFEKYTSWDTLLPSVFGLSNNEFEKNWHSYLKQWYPREKN